MNKKATTTDRCLKTMKDREEKTVWVAEGCCCTMPWFVFFV